MYGFIHRSHRSVPLSSGLCSSGGCGHSWLRVLTRQQSSCQSRLQSLQGQAEEESTCSPQAVADILVLFFGSGGLDPSFSAGVPSSRAPQGSCTGAHGVAAVRTQERSRAEARREARVWRLSRKWQFTTCPTQCLLVLSC